MNLNTSNLSRLYFFYAACLALCLFLPTASRAQTPLPGLSTKLEITILKTPMSHEGDEGQSRIRLIEKNTTRILFEETWDGLWHGLGYNPDTGTYILAGEFGMASWRPLRAIRYLDEVPAKSRPSRYNENSFYAFTAVSSPRAHYIAFVGGLSSTSAPHLIVLKTASDSFQELGPAPAPPALDASKGETASEEEWGWGKDYRDTYVPMDEGIMLFPKEDQLTINYGQDSADKRGKKRQVKSWNLKTLKW